MAEQQSRIAAIDLGSNSFHLLLADCDQQGWQPRLELGRKVQLAADLDANGLNEAAIERGLACLSDYAEHLRGLSPEQVRIVGTQALREASNRHRFIEPAEAILGYPIEVISGAEEAQLVYRAVTGECGAILAEHTLVVDVGGASTEFACGVGREAERVCSVPVGCVSSLNHFPEGEITPAAFQAAVDEATQRLAASLASFDCAWSRSIGCSGTLLAIEQVLIGRQLSLGGITREALQGLREALLQCHHFAEVQFAGLSESRRSVFASGLAITLALFDVLGLERMALSSAALREGVVCELAEQLQEPVLIS